jgi:hypothetical protein
VTLGEGWHNNHHYYLASARQGFYRWEVDITFYGLKVLSWFHIVRELRKVPDQILAEGQTLDSVACSSVSHPTKPCIQFDRCAGPSRGGN